MNGPYMAPAFAAGEGQYIFANPGRQGGDSTGTPDPVGTDQCPVTEISWRDAMIWCNALTEWYNAKTGAAPGLNCVYCSDSDYETPLRAVNGDAVPELIPSGSQDDPFVDESATGFRLLSGNEWECASRNIDGSVWLYGDHASGDETGPCYIEAPATAGLGGLSLSTIFEDYAQIEGSTANVKSKLANALGLYDMSGNVSELCFDWWAGGMGPSRQERGGAWGLGAGELQVGKLGGNSPDNTSPACGFRFARSAP